MVEVFLFIVVFAFLMLFFLRVFIKYSSKLVNSSFVSHRFKSFNYVKILYYGGYLITLFGCLALFLLFDINTSIVDNIQSLGYYIFMIWGYFVVFRGFVGQAFNERDILNIDDCFLQKFRHFFIYSAIFWAFMLIVSSIP